MNITIPFLKDKNPNRAVALGYFSYVLAGTILLSLPFLRVIKEVSFLDNLFIAVSAVSTTGLVTVSVGDTYNFWGQLIVIALIQLGGIGYMTLGSFLVLSVNDRIGLSRGEVQKYVFSLPVHIDTKRFVRTLIFYTLSVEAAGAAMLFIFFRASNTPGALWSAVFHSVSAFCTAGFSIYNNSLESFALDTGVNLTISALSILGSVGFIVVYDVWNHKVKAKRPLSLTSKTILWSTVLLILFGAAILFFFEPTLAARPLGGRLLASYFQSMTSLTTAGFNTVPIPGLSILSLFLITLLMVIGASPSGTGGGLKTTTFTTLIGVMRSTLAGDKEVKFLRRTIPTARVWLAVSSLGFYLSALIIIAFLMLLQNSQFNFQQIFFEVASALGTVGLSAGITPYLSAVEKILIIITMFIGRIGPLSFGIALFWRRDVGGFIGLPEEDLAV